MKKDEKREKIKKYWDERAEQSSGALAATTNDVYLRELEIATVIETLQQIPLPESGQVLDVGCGDGYSTLKVAQSFPNLNFLGIDYSENMIKAALKQLEAQPELKERVAFVVGDVMQLREVCGSGVYDVILSDRCLINLDSVENQAHTIARIAEHTKPGGYYIAIENFIEGHDNMNRARSKVGLPEIPVRWHNLYFREQEFVHSAERFFEDIVFKDFSSSYYFATRVIYSKMCHMRGEEPDYNHEIHQLSVRLPWIGQFSPIRMAVMRKKLS